MSNRRSAGPSICGPVKDGQFTVWVVRGPKGGQLGEFFTREAARLFIKTHRKPKKELLHVTR
jgi:hypothetical protein